MYCTKCGHRNDGQARFCEKCGAAIQNVKEGATFHRRTSPATIEKVAKVPSRRSYVIGAAVLIVGVVVCVVFLVTQLFNLLDSIVPEIQVVVPGTHEIYLAEPGEYTVFYEYRSVVDNKVYSTGEISGMSVILKSKDDQQEVALSKPSGSTTYEVGGRAGESVLEFEIDEPGTYVFTADYSGGVGGPDVVLAIGQFELWGTIRTVLVGLGIFFGAFIIGGFIIVRTFLKRRKVA